MSNWKPLPEEVTAVITLPLMACLGGAIIAPVLQSFHYLKYGVWLNYSIAEWLRYFEIDPTTGWVGVDQIVETTHVSFVLGAFALLWFFLFIALQD